MIIQIPLVEPAVPEGIRELYYGRLPPFVCLRMRVY